MISKLSKDHEGMSVLIEYSPPAVLREPNDNANSSWTPCNLTWRWPAAILLHHERWSFRYCKQSCPVRPHPKAFWWDHRTRVHEVCFFVLAHLKIKNRKRTHWGKSWGLYGGKKPNSSLPQSGLQFQFKFLDSNLETKRIFELQATSEHAKSAAVPRSNQSCFTDPNWWNMVWASNLTINKYHQHIRKYLGCLDPWMIFCNKGTFQNATSMPRFQGLLPTTWHEWKPNHEIQPCSCLCMPLWCHSHPAETCAGFWEEDKWLKRNPEAKSCSCCHK